MSSVSCTARIGSLSLKIKGGIVGWILNLFRGKIASKLKPSLEREVCKAAKKFAENDVNAKLRTFPTTVSLGRNFRLNYGLKSDPKVDGGSIITQHNGEISYRGTGGATFHPHDLIQTFSNSKMLYLFGSDFILNSFLSSAHKNNQMKYTLNERTLPRAARYLSTSCSGICLGTLFPKLKDEYPNSKGSARFETTADPTVLFSTGKATVNARGTMQLFVRTVRILTANVFLTAELTPSLTSDFRKVTGSADIKTLRVTNVTSSLEDLGQPELQSLVNFATPLLEELANNYLRKGIPIPVTRGVRLTNGQLRLLQRTAEISADVIYS